ncbi:MAG TPA: LemA family protein [Candidatus Paceibacterota bacterium]|nr:LemA family protein [Candidatus Paceibacterota bacterium]
MNTTLILTVVAAVIVLWLIATFNSLIRWRNRVKESWSDIDVQLKRRYDLIPNLVETVKGYASHERGALEAVITARAKAMGATSVAEHAQAENMLSGALKNLFALAEAYPDLKAVSAFTELQRELADTENKIQAARRFYNTNVMSFNTKQESFPTNFIAGVLGFKKSDFFELSEAVAREPVKVQF